HSPVFDGDVLVDEIPHLRLHLNEIRSREPSEQIDPVDTFVDEGAARNVPGIDKPSGTARPVPVFRNRPSARLVDQDDLADLPLADPRLQVRRAQPHDPLEWKADDPRLL